MRTSDRENIRWLRRRRGRRLAQRSSNSRSQFARLDRLQKMRRHAEFLTAFGTTVAVCRGEHDDRRAGEARIRAQRFHELETIHLWHIPIEQEQAKRRS